MLEIEHLRQDNINIIVSGRRTGKTTALIEECAKVNGLMVVRNQELASWIYETAKKDGYDIKKPITYDDLLKGYKLAGRRQDVLFLDDLDWFVRRLCGWNPVGMVSFAGNAFFTKLEIEKIRKGEG